jgi:UDP-N-acetylglucosamine 2-epimerase (non-hydrolysing)
MASPIKILSVFGTRPEAIKMAPLVRLLSETPGIESKLCVTAQHRRMLDHALDVFDLQPDWDLDLMRTGQDLYDLTARVIEGMKRRLQEAPPDIVLVHGDTTTTFAVSLAAFYAKIPVGHVEAGLRTYDRYSPYPEEMNRRMTDVLSELHFAPTLRAKANLWPKESPKGVSVTRNTAIDAFFDLERIRSGAIQPENPLQDEDPSRRIVLVTAHRRESFGKGFARLCEGLKKLCEKFPETLFVYPVHLNPNVREPVERHLSRLPNMRLVEPLPYAPFVELMSRSTLILTDSGGVQEEAPSLGKPVLVLRETTERPEAIEAGTAILVGVDPERIVDEASRILLSEETKSTDRLINPYGDGLASQRIVNALLEWKELPEPSTFHRFKRVG